jgi:hypothetical protein
MLRRDSTIDELARRLARRDTQVRVPRQFPVFSRQAVITSVDHGGFNCNILLAGSLVEIPTVSYIQAYSPAHLPQVDHTCIVHVNGHDIQVMGQHISPFDFITI